MKYLKRYIHHLLISTSLISVWITFLYCTQT